MATLRLILALATNLNWSVKQLDINNAFLNGVLQEVVYMWQPAGFKDSRYPHHVCKLRKAIYCLRQAPRSWFEWLRMTLNSWRFFNSRGDSSLFIQKTRNSLIILLIYVDDILVTGSHVVELKHFITRLNQVFSFKDLGDLHYFLGFEVKRDDSGLFLSQKRYIQDLLAKLNFSTATCSSTPMSAGKQFFVE